jgi:hypothetical protein
VYWPRARVGVDGDDLRADQGSDDRVEFHVSESGQRGKPGLGEALAQHGRVLEDAPFDEREPVQTSGDERMQCFRDLESVDRPAEPVLLVLSRQRPRSSSMRTVSTA